jgi:hypothetical protein
VLIAMTARLKEARHCYKDEKPFCQCAIAHRQQLDTEGEVSFANLRARRFMSSFVNGVLHGFILRATPLVLMQSESNLDFVKDAFAILFIVCLDDIDEKVAHRSRANSNGSRASPFPTRH